ncbi:MAG: hypothetical protein WBW46_00495 [Candidatus Sulfotelmatobacter sp.]
MSSILDEKIREAEWKHYLVERYLPPCQAAGFTDLALTPEEVFFLGGMILHDSEIHALAWNRCDKTAAVVDTYPLALQVLGELGESQKQILRERVQRRNLEFFRGISMKQAGAVRP